MQTSWSSGLRVPVSPWRDAGLPQVSHLTLTDRGALLRDVFTAAGGTHDDWDAYDRTMRDERRTAVLITPTRVYSNRRS